MRLRDAVTAVHETGDFTAIQEAIPYTRFMGITAQLVNDDVIGRMRYSDHLVGNASIPALHGGTLGALMESTAIFKLLWNGETTAVPKTINITVEYLRSARPEDVFARAEFTRRGRRVANVRIFAYQNDPECPVAVATAHFLLVQE
ncbi:MAG: PaaI family thioesterase [Deltaproteobacteria bacterium]|nr:PaaI family thioesterase [Deltaproteobacteria bacterium]MBW1873909.1 PaaI family thioesterase [Deltaproteobacteria bacterium]MBW2210119.1 PaaI family thioesterase [Deltaproteobacteria bacterium]MBW2212948.1 PaaI family thioesterase [Deltaproteobacteria bacterium]MBW2378110.1 PaaI family thioesterase [Deltaproteobacteria bacterium]